MRVSQAPRSSSLATKALREATDLATALWELSGGAESSDGKLKLGLFSLTFCQAFVCVSDGPERERSIRLIRSLIVILHLMTDVPEHQQLASDLTLFKQLPWDKIAVVLVDFQNDFCDEKGKAAPVHTKNNAQAANKANEFAAQVVQLGAHIIYTRQVIDPAKLTERQKRWEKPDGLCQIGSWGAELYIKPVKGSVVVIKNRFDIWRSQEFLDYLEQNDIQGLVITGVELACCVLYAVMGADERGYQYVVPQDLVSGIDTGDETYNKAIRDYLGYSHAAISTATALLK